MVVNCRSKNTPTYLYVLLLPPTCRLWPSSSILPSAVNTYYRTRPFLFSCLGGSDSHVIPLGLDVHSLFLQIPITLITCVMMLIKPSTSVEMVFNSMILDNPILLPTLFSVTVKILDPIVLIRPNADLGYVFPSFPSSSPLKPPPWVVWSLGPSFDWVLNPTGTKNVLTWNCWQRSMKPKPLKFSFAMPGRLLTFVASAFCFKFPNRWFF